MPTYGYECEVCHHKFEVFQRITADPIKACEKCGGPVHRLMYPVGVVFKGSGWYVTDNHRPNPGVGGTDYGTTDTAGDTKPQPAETAKPKTEASTAPAPASEKKTPAAASSK